MSVRTRRPCGSRDADGHRCCLHDHVYPGRHMAWDGDRWHYWNDVSTRIEDEPAPKENP